MALSMAEKSVVLPSLGLDEGLELGLVDAL